MRRIQFGSVVVILNSQRRMNFSRRQPVLRHDTLNRVIAIRIHAGDHLCFEMGFPFYARLPVSYHDMVNELHCQFAPYPTDQLNPSAAAFQSRGQRLEFRW